MKRTRVPVKPASGPEASQYARKTRLEKHVRRRWRAECREVVVRFRGAFAYLDAFPRERQDVTSATENERERFEAIPVHLCRLRYLGSESAWEFAFYKYSDEKYQLSLSMSGSFESTPEEAFDCAARIYLAN